MCKSAFMGLQNSYYKHPKNNPNMSFHFLNNRRYPHLHSTPGHFSHKGIIPVPFPPAPSCRWHGFMWTSVVCLASHFQGIESTATLLHGTAVLVFILFGQAGCRELELMRDRTWQWDLLDKLWNFWLLSHILQEQQRMGCWGHTAQPWYPNKYSRRENSTHGLDVVNPDVSWGTRRKLMPSPGHWSRWGSYQVMTLIIIL